MMMGNNFMVSYKTFEVSVWHQEYFIAEKSARDFANEKFAVGGATVIELYSRTKTGWQLVKSVKENAKVAEAKWKAYQQSLIPAGCTITYNA